MKKLILIPVSLSLMVLLINCSKHCATCPDTKPSVEKDYHFLYSFVGSFSQARLYTFSSRTGDVVDTAYYGRYPFGDAEFSQDGRRLYCTGSDYNGVWVINWPKGDTLAINRDINGQYLALSHNENYLLVSGGALAYILALPELQIVYQTSEEGNWDKGAFSPLKDVAYIPNWGEDSLLVVDLGQQGISAYKRPLRTSSGEPVSAVSVVVSLDGARLILEGGMPSGGPTYIQIRDPGTLNLIEEIPHPDGVGSYLHPDGVRVFFLAHWSFDGAPSSIWELNLSTFLFRRIFDGGDSSFSNPFHALDPVDMDFTPDGKYAFIINGGGWAQGPIFKWDMDSYKIVDAFYPPRGVSRTIRINPVEVAGAN